MSHDSDSDGVLNNYDECANTRKGMVVNQQGCSVFQIVLVNFEFDSAEISKDSIVELDNAVTVLLSVPDINVEVQGHADEIGSKLYNQILSEQRANNVRKYLVKQGVSADKFEAKGYGELLFLVDNDTSSLRAKNRRVQLKVLED